MRPAGKSAFRGTRYACYLGYVVQAAANFAPLLYLTFQQEFALDLTQIGLLSAACFGTQLVVDCLAVYFVDRIGYRASVLIADGTSAAGLLGMALFPSVFAPYAGLWMAVMLYSVGAGLMEVLVSPIVDACPAEDHRNHMGLLHSFYCWGFAGVVLLSSVFFRLAGMENWRVLACLWALLPLGNAALFARVPIPVQPAHTRWSIRALAEDRRFWGFVLLMLCAGAAEASISQWLSAFVESGLHIPKQISDLLGPCVFAVLMAVSRMIFGLAGERLHLPSYMAVCAALGTVGYLLVAFSGDPVPALAGCVLCGFGVSVMWPGTISLAAGSPMSGTAMFALLALAGDLGCMLGPTLVGIWADRTGSLQAGLGAVLPFPLLLTVSLALIACRDRRSRPAV